MPLPFSAPPWRRHRLSCSGCDASVGARRAEVMAGTPASLSGQDEGFVSLSSPSPSAAVPPPCFSGKPGLAGNLWVTIRNAAAGRGRLVQPFGPARRRVGSASSGSEAARGRWAKPAGCGCPPGSGLGSVSSLLPECWERTTHPAEILRSPGFSLLSLFRPFRRLML